MRELTQDIAEFRYAMPGGPVSHCRLRIYEDTRGAAFREFRPVIIATEVADNPGTSITNAAEHVYAAAMRQVSSGSYQPLYIEHYCLDSYAEPVGPDRLIGEESFAEVAFLWRDGKPTCPSWHPLSARAVGRMIGAEDESINERGQAEAVGAAPYWAGLD